MIFDALVWFYYMIRTLKWSYKHKTQRLKRFQKKLFYLEKMFFQVKLTWIMSDFIINFPICKKVLLQPCDVLLLFLFWMIVFILKVASVSGISFHLFPNDQSVTQSILFDEEPYLTCSLNCLKHFEVLCMYLSRGNMFVMS